MSIHVAAWPGFSIRSDQILLLPFLICLIMYLINITFSLYNCSCCMEFQINGRMLLDSPFFFNPHIRKNRPNHQSYLNSTILRFRCNSFQTVDHHKCSHHLHRNQPTYHNPDHNLLHPRLHVKTQNIKKGVQFDKCSFPSCADSASRLHNSI